MSFFRNYNDSRVACAVVSGITVIVPFPPETIVWYSNLTLINNIAKPYTNHKNQNTVNVTSFTLLNTNKTTGARDIYTSV